MSFTLVFKPSAQTEIAEAFTWYEAQNTGLGRNFLDELERVERVICFNPRLYPMAEGEIRRAGLRRFPYSVFYVVDDKQVQVLACFHQRREPRSMRPS